MPLTRSRRKGHHGTHFYSMVTAPAVSPAAGNVVESIASTTRSAPTVTLNVMFSRGGDPSPKSTEAVPLKVARPSAATEPSLTFPSTVISRGNPNELPCSPAWNVPDAEPPASMNTPVPISIPWNSTGPSSAPAAKRPVAAPVTERSSLSARTGAVVIATSPRRIGSTQVSRFMVFLCLFVDLNVAAAQRASRGVAVTHGDRERVSILAGLVDVAYVDVEIERSGTVDCRRAKDLGAVARDGHRRDSGTLDGPGQNPVVLICEVSARSATRLRSQTESPPAAYDCDPAARRDFGAGRARGQCAEVLEAAKRRSVEREERKLVDHEPAVPIAADRRADDVGRIAQRPRHHWNTQGILDRQVHSQHAAAVIPEAVLEGVPALRGDRVRHPARILRKSAASGCVVAGANDEPGTGTGCVRVCVEAGVEDEVASMAAPWRVDC